MNSFLTTLNWTITNLHCSCHLDWKYIWTIVIFGLKSFELERSMDRDTFKFHDLALALIEFCCPSSILLMYTCEYDQVNEGQHAHQLVDPTINIGKV